MLADGVARVNDPTAAALRATNSYGLIEPPMVEASVVSRIPEQVYVSPLPDKASDAPVGDSLMVEQRTLTPLVLVRIQVPQPFRSTR